MKMLYRMEQNKYAWSYLQRSFFICSSLINPPCISLAIRIMPVYVTFLLLIPAFQTFTSLLPGGFFEDRAYQNKFCSPVLKKSS